MKIKEWFQCTLFCLLFGIGSGMGADMGLIYVLLIATGVYLVEVMLSLITYTDSQHITTAKYCRHFAVALQPVCSGAATYLQYHCTRVALPLQKGCSDIAYYWQEQCMPYPESVLALSGRKKQHP